MRTKSGAMIMRNEYSFKKMNVVSRYFTVIHHVDWNMKNELFNYGYNVLKIVNYTTAFSNTSL